MAYTTIEQVTSAMGSLTDEQTAYFSSTLDAAIDKYINKETETYFGETASTTAYASGDGTSTLIIPTMHTITAVKDESGNVVPAETYYAYPRHSYEKYAIMGQNWSEGVENYRIEGIMGYKTVPADIISVATELAVNKLSGLTASTKGYKSEKTGDWSATYLDGEKNLSTNSLSTLSGYLRLSRSM